MKNIYKLDLRERSEKAKEIQKLSKKETSREEKEMHHANLQYQVFF